MHYSIDAVSWQVAVFIKASLDSDSPRTYLQPTLVIGAISAEVSGKTLHGPVSFGAHSSCTAAGQPLVQSSRQNIMVGAPLELSSESAILQDFARIDIHMNARAPLWNIASKYELLQMIISAAELHPFAGQRNIEWITNAMRHMS